MPRSKRNLMDGGIYHVLNRGNAKREVFHKDMDYQAFLDLMKEARLRSPLKFFAYCLMPNHFHFVIECIRAESLSEYMQWLMTTHVTRYNRHYGESGHVWQGRYKAFLVDKDEYLLTVLRYVEANPVRAGIVNTAREWTWSSHRQRIGEISPELLDDPPVVLPAHWEDWVAHSLGEAELASIRQSVNRQTPYGHESWQKKIIEKLGLESTIRPRGRPKSKRGQSLF